MKIVILDGYTLNPGDLSWEELYDLGEVTIYDRTNSDDIVSRIGDAEIVLTNKTPISKDTIEMCTKLKYIGVLATGYNVVDVKAAKHNEIVVTNIPTYGTQTVAQFVFALLLEICHRVGDHDRSVKLGKWKESKDFCYWQNPLIELAGKSIGIIGTGKIGRSTAQIAQAFGMNVLAYDVYPDETLTSNTFKYVELEDLFKDSDVISLHCPLFEDTKGIINKNTIDMMKDGVIIINTSRGPLIVENDLKAGLDSGKIYGAALDVLEKEPPVDGSVLFDSERCIITPHIAWATKEARTRLMHIATENLKAYLNHDIMNSVNM